MAWGSVRRYGSTRGIGSDQAQTVEPLAITWSLGGSSIHFTKWALPWPEATAYLFAAKADHAVDVFVLDGTQPQASTRGLRNRALSLYERGVVGKDPRFDRCIV